MFWKTSILSSMHPTCQYCFNEVNHCLAAICTGGCKNGGTCILPETCSCVPGWTGQYCETGMYMVIWGISQMPLETLFKSHCQINFLQVSCLFTLFTS